MLLNVCDWKMCCVLLLFASLRSNVADADVHCIWCTFGVVVVLHTANMCVGDVQEYRASAGMLSRQGSTYGRSRTCSVSVRHHCLLAWALPHNSSSTTKCSYLC